ncbi:MAG: hypothetical protein P8J01_03430 [Acidimicrobiales bacterium]|nr:hypothetical protein [Acidimicrobiales bacterium]
MAYINIPDGEDPERVRLWKMVPDMNNAIQAFSSSMFTSGIISNREREAARFRIAQINECDI